MSSEHTPVGQPPADEPMESVREFGRRWDRFWFAPSDPTTYAA